MATNRRKKQPKTSRKKRASEDAGIRDELDDFDDADVVSADAADVDGPGRLSHSVVPFVLSVALIVLLLVVHYGLWLGHNSVPDYVGLTHEISGVRSELDALADRNGALQNEVMSLKSGFAAVEARARNDLGLVKEGETFFQIIEQVPPANSSTTIPSEQRPAQR